jgi:hypothetical protein
MGHTQPVGVPAWNACTDRLRMLVVDSGDTFALQWRGVRRDIRADWDAAFGGAMPRIAVAPVGADTDNTDGSVGVRFSDLKLSQLPGTAPAAARRTISKAGPASLY